MTRKNILLGLVIMLATSMLLGGCAGKKAAITIELEENPTTGFAWSYEMTPQDVLTETKSEFVKPKSNAMGAPGKHVWEFAPAKDGAVTLTFTYKRDWEGGETANVVTYTYEVKGKKVTELSRTENK